MLGFTIVHVGINETDEATASSTADAEAVRFCSK